MSVKKKTSVALFVIAAFLAGVFFTTAGANVFDLGEETTPSSRAAGTTRLAGAPYDFQSSFTKVAEAVSPTVVQIQAAKAPDQRRMNPLRRFFGRGRPDGQQPLRQGVGSGVVVRSDGYIVTNNHVVEEAEELTVVMHDGTQYDGEIVGTDPQSDLAVLKVDAEDLPTISYANSDNVEVGDWVMAFGSPLSRDLENTVTAGIISAKGRVSRTTSEINQIAELLQTDAAVNPGNSGGPLVNLQGELVGINSAIASQTGGYQGISFAIPSNLVENITRQLIETGGVARGYLGVRFRSVSPALASDLNVPRGAAQVAEVTSGSAAEEAGLQQGDIITEINGEELSNFNELRTTVGSKQPGDSVELTVVSGESGEERTVDVELGNRPEELASNDSPSQDRDDSSGGSGAEEQLDDLGLSLRSVTPRFLQRQRLPAREEFRGAAITSVEPRSYAYREAELRQGQIITHVAGQRVRSLEEFVEVYRQVEPGTSFRVRTLQVSASRGGEVQSASGLTALRKPSN
jgi:serine protease Do